MNHNTKQHPDPDQPTKRKEKKRKETARIIVPT
jgi:hypothetical protein